MALEGDLTTLAAVKGWLTIPNNTASDEVLTRLVTSASGWVQTIMSRQILPQDYTDVVSGNGGFSMMMTSRPIVAVSSVEIDGAAIPESASALRSGYVFDANVLSLRGYRFNRGVMNVKVAYAAGLQRQASAKIPSGAPYVLTMREFAPTWASDRGISLQSGQAMTRVVTSPAAGQYAISAEAGEWKATFNSANAGAALFVDYGYVPPELEQVVIELVGERFKARDNIGQTSKNIGDGQVVSFTFSTRDLNENAKRVLNNLSRKILP